MVPNDATVGPSSIESEVSFGEVTITMSTSFWLVWGRSAIEAEARAWGARNADDADKLSREMRSGIECICATVFSLEAFQRRVVSKLGIPLPTSRKSALGYLRWSLRPCLDLADSQLDSLIQGVAPYYAKRHESVHYEETLAPAVPHPIGGNSSVSALDYRAEEARGALEAMRNIYRDVRDHPTDLAKEFSEQHRHVLIQLTEDPA